MISPLKKLPKQIDYEDMTNLISNIPLHTKNVNTSFALMLRVDSIRPTIFYIGSSRSQVHILLLEPLIMGNNKHENDSHKQIFHEPGCIAMDNHFNVANKPKLPKESCDILSIEGRCSKTYWRHHHWQEAQVFLMCFLYL